MLFAHGINFNDFPLHRKRGCCWVEGTMDWEIPVFTQDRSYVERHVLIRED